MGTLLDRYNAQSKGYAPDLVPPQSPHHRPIATVRIDHPDVPGGVLINAHDFDPAKHLRFGEKRPEPAAETPPETPADDAGKGGKPKA